MQTLESKQVDFSTQVSTLQSTSSSHNDIIEGLQADVKELDSRLESRDSEIEGLRAELDEAHSVAETQAAANEKLRDLLARMASRLDEVEAQLKASQEENAAYRSASETKLASLESTVQQLRDDPLQRSVAPSPSPYPSTYTLLEQRASPAMDFRYLDLELTSTPSSRRRKVPVVGRNDVLLQYNGFGRTSVEGSAEGPRYF